jgi:hypothetical protein
MMRGGYVTNQQETTLMIALLSNLLLSLQEGQPSTVRKESWRGGKKEKEKEKEKMYSNEALYVI